MLHEFLRDNRIELIARCVAKVAQRTAPKSSEEELEHGIPLFLDQLIETLRVETTSQPMQSREISGAAGGVQSEFSELGKTAVLHGRELLKRGFTVEQVVHDYGDLCQAITDLAFELRAPIAIDEFRTLNRCLDNGIADAVTAFNCQRDANVADQQAQEMNEHLGVFAHELRNMLMTATLSLSAIKAGNVGVNGATGAILERSLIGMSNLIDRSLADVRMSASLPMPHRLFPLAEFIAEVKVSASLEAEVKECILIVSDVDPLLGIRADRDLLLSAVGNILQNAFKFTRPHTEVTVTAYSTGSRILIDIEDHGAGLSSEKAEKMFLPFTQGGEDKSGLGLGLSIARRSVEANDGNISVRNKPDAGCIFTIDLPCHSLS